MPNSGTKMERKLSVGGGFQGLDLIQPQPFLKSDAIID